MRKLLVPYYEDSPLLSLIYFYLVSAHQHPCDVYPECRVNLPAEGLPLCKQRLLCVWNWRGRHSSAQASSKDPNSCKNNPESCRERKPIHSSWVAASLKVDNRCQCFLKPSWCQQAEPNARPPSSPSVLLHELCKGSGLFQRQICLFLVDYGCSQSSFSNWICTGQIKHHHLFRTAWQQRGVSTSWEVGRSYFPFLTQIRYMLPSWEPRLLSCLFHIFWPIALRTSF